MPTYHDVFANVQNLPLYYALVYWKKDVKPTLGGDDIGYYVEKTSAAATLTGFFNRALPHKLQSYTASVTFRLSVSDTSLTTNVGIVVGGNEAANKILAVSYTLDTGKLRIRSFDYEAGSSTTEAESTETYYASNDTDYVLEVTVTYDGTNLSVDVALKDTVGTTLLTLSGTFTGYYPIFGLHWGLGYSQTGRIYFRNATINFTENPNVYDMRVIKSPDINVYDWVGCPRLVFFEHPDGRWRPYHPDGYPRVVLRWHDESGNAGKNLMMYKIVGDPRDPSNWVGEGQVFDRDQLGWGSFEEFCLLWRKDDTWIALVGGSESGPWNIYKLTSDDLGVTWNVEKILKSDHKRISIWVDEGGLIHALYNTYPPGDVKYGQSLDLGDTLNDVRTYSGYRGGAIYYVGDKYLLALEKMATTDNEYYFRCGLDLFETIDFNTLTPVASDVFPPVTELPFTLYMNGGMYPALLRYNNSIFLAAEVFPVDHDPNDGFTDQLQRHLAVLYDPVATYVGKIKTSLTLEAIPL